ncbi:MAG: AI-2E family transporter [Micromonosporaceae bacterium]
MSRFQALVRRMRQAWGSDPVYSDRAWSPSRPDDSEHLTSESAASGSAQEPPAPSTADNADGEHLLAPLSRRDDVMVSRGVRIGAAWSWRLLVIGVAVATAVWLLVYVRLVVIPLVVALLLAALLEPAAGRLRRWGTHRSLAAAIVLIGGLGAVVGILAAVVNAFIDGMPQLFRNVQRGVAQIQSWLRDEPLNLSQRQLQQGFDNANQWLMENRDRFTEGAVSTASEAAVTVGHVLVGLVLVLFALFFFMRDGRGIWGFVTGMLPRAAQEPVRAAGDASWRTLTSYVRATVLVAFIDAVGIGLAAFLLDLPLWFPIAALVFLSSFIPIVGATVSGAVAALVALVTQGPVDALLMLAAVIIVQQVEGHLLQPLLLGRAVSLHPLAVIIAITAGAVVAGIVGALISVPLIAVVNTAVRHLHGVRDSEPEPPGPPEPAVSSAG